ncbi:MAG: HEPN domain-containing protein [Acidobacteria bacterium]|nr:HEPN domain-containing protein [Acidobacteriota bacterium]
MKELHELIRYRLERAKETVDEANLLAGAGHWNACVNRLYYASFYAVSALLGIHPSRHTGVRSAFGQHYIRTGLISKDLGTLYNDLFESRLEGDYEDFTRMDPEMVRPWLGRVADLLREIDRLITTKNSLPSK